MDLEFLLVDWLGKPLWMWLAFIGIVILPLLSVMQLGLTLLAARRAAAGIDYRYPLTFHMV